VVDHQARRRVIDAIDVRLTVRRTEPRPAVTLLLDERTEHVEDCSIVCIGSLAASEASQEDVEAHAGQSSRTDAVW
jgi:hypothetical protein